LKEMELKKRFMGVIVYNIWKRKLRRWGADPGSVAPIHLNNFRQLATCFTATKIDVIEVRAIKTLKEFLIDNVTLENMRIKVRELYRNIGFMQKRLRAQLQTKGAKVDVLINYWDKIYG